MATKNSSPPRHHHVEAAQVSGQAPRDLPHHLVARGMAVPVVGLLEMVDVADDEREEPA
jgi:hypothetical protein